MIKNTHSGLLIAFEGLDGSGVSTQAALLSGILSREGYRVHITKEPTNGLIGGLIRAQLTREWKTDPETLQLLFAADRAHHLKTEIIPNLVAGKIVISDRYAFSSMAYGSLYVDDVKWLSRINENFILPDITFLLKVDPKICAKNVKKSRYEIELFEKEKELKKVWRAYQELAEKHKDIFIINGEQEEGKIVDDIMKVMRKKLGTGKKNK